MDRIPENRAARPSQSNPDYDPRDLRARRPPPPDPARRANNNQPPQEGGPRRSSVAQLSYERQQKQEQRQPPPQVQQQQLPQQDVRQDWKADDEASRSHSPTRPGVELRLGPIVDSELAC